MCASDQADQNQSGMSEEALDPCLSKEGAAKPLIRLRGCASCSESDIPSICKQYRSRQVGSKKANRSGFIMWICINNLDEVI